MARNRNEMRGDIKGPFPQSLKKRMKEKGVTITDLAAHLGVTTSAVDRYQTGASGVSMSTLKKIAEKLECSTDYLLGIVEDPSPDPNIRMIRDYTGLSDNAIEMLHNFKTGRVVKVNGKEIHVLPNDKVRVVLNAILEFDYACCMSEKLRLDDDQTSDPSSFDNVFEMFSLDDRVSGEDPEKIEFIEFRANKNFMGDVFRARSYSHDPSAIDEIKGSRRFARKRQKNDRQHKDNSFQE